ncbi:hypothetical protein E0485_04455 [Paenibacillus albiflavus]|uniref:Uncharacterized protein n=1 Tax=Paenibacillus albiflavus TaxID=2545760 RepID=A0A4V2WPP0_9BACL|nr:hypothetical protein [Paenibacillus albiflavus]TCZ80112.1 hypothetical protein E0485_04455 [Paenibacillus albiflavus]
MKISKMITILLPALVMVVYLLIFNYDLLGISGLNRKGWLLTILPAAFLIQGIASVITKTNIFVTLIVSCLAYFGLLYLSLETSDISYLILYLIVYAVGYVIGWFVRKSK